MIKLTAHILDDSGFVFPSNENKVNRDCCCDDAKSNSCKIKQKIIQMSIISAGHLSPWGWLSWGPQWWRWCRGCRWLGRRDSPWSASPSQAASTAARECRKRRDQLRPLRRKFYWTPNSIKRFLRNCASCVILVMRSRAEENIFIEEANNFFDINHSCTDIKIAPVMKISY